jgi:integrase
MSTSWETRWGYELRLVKPCVYKLKTGGYLIRPKVNGKHRLRVLPDAKSLADVDRALVALRDEVRASPENPSFQSFAVSLFKERVLSGEITSASTREQWKSTLEYYLIPPLGEFLVDEIDHLKIVELRKEFAGFIRYGKPDLKDPKKTIKIAPSTANGWLRKLRTICNVMTVRFNLPRNPFDGIEYFKEAEVYTEEEPNSLTPEKMRLWLNKAVEFYPQHYAMMVLGFITGRRPGELRAIRKKEDVDWVNGKVRIHRSHSRGTEISPRTKTGKVVTLHLPKEVMQILEDHVRALPPGAMAESEFLFPSTTGGLRSRSGLDKPFKRLCKLCKINYRVTPKAMRRSFQDLMRAAEVEGIVTRSISGHKTEKMQDHYSTVAANEKRAALQRAVELVK